MLEFCQVLDHRPQKNQPPLAIIDAQKGMEQNSIPFVYSLVSMALLLGGDRALLAGMVNHIVSTQDQLGYGNDFISLLQ